MTTSLAPLGYLVPERLSFKGAGMAFREACSRPPQEAHPLQKAAIHNSSNTDRLTSFSADVTSPREDGDF